MRAIQAFHQERSLRYLSAEEHRIDSQLHVQLPRGEHPWFGFVRQGAVSVTVTGEGWRRTGNAAVGVVFLVPPQGLSSIQNTGRQAAQLLLIRFQSEETAMVPGDARLICFRMPHLQNWVGDFLQADVKKDPVQYYQVQSHLYAMAAECIQAVMQPADGSDDLLEYVRGIKQSMQEECGEPVDIEETARLSGASATRFYQMFKRCTGFSPLRFLTMTRLHTSLRLLANHALSIKEVAYEIGYPDELYFSRLFRKQMRLSPTEYALRAQRRIASLSPLLSGDLAVLGITPALELPSGWEDGPNKERFLGQLEASRPDLIVTEPVPPAVYEALSGIATVKVIEHRESAWQDRFADIARLLDLPSVAERWLSWLEAQVENARHLLNAEFGTGYVWVTAVGGPESFRLLDVVTLEEVDAADAAHVFVLAPSSFANEVGSTLERINKPYTLLRHQEEWIGNAASCRRLIESTVEHLLSRK